MKNKWQSAICREYSIRSLDAARAARILVMVVPMFAPNVNGNTLSIETIPSPTKGVSAEVKIELDWTSMVIHAPTKIAK